MSQLKIQQYPRNADGTPMDLQVGVLTDSTGNGGARLTSPPLGPDGAPIDAYGFVLVDGSGSPVGTGLQVASNKTQLANASTANGTFLATQTDHGFFYYDTTNFVTKFGANLNTIDPLQAIFVPPASDATGASGAWVRRYTDILISWFGIDPLGLANDGAKVLAAYTLAFALAGTNTLTGYSGAACPSVRFPFLPAGINMGSTTIALTKAISTFGEANSEPGGSATWLKWSGDCNGFEVRAANCHFDGIAGRGSWTTASPAEGEFHFIKGYFRFSYGRLYANKWRGDAIHVNITAGSGGDTEGNANGVRGQWIWASDCRRAVSMEGADANAGVFTFVDANYCREAGVYEASFLGNHYDAIQTAGCGVQGIAGLPTNAAFNNGHIFYVISGQEAGASTNSPPTTATDNTWWAYWKDSGAATAYAPQWVSGMTFRAGSGIIIPLPKVSNASTIDYLYTEVDQPPIQIAQVSMLRGGLIAAGYHPTTRRINATFRGIEIAPSLYVPGNFTQEITAVNQTFIIDASNLVWNPLLIMKTGSTASTIQFQNSAGVVQASISGNNGFGLLLDGTLGVIARFNGTNVANTTSTGFNIASGKLLSFNGVTIINSSGVLQAAGVPAFAGGDVTSAGATLVLNIAAGAVTYAKFQQVAASSLVGNPTGSLATAQGITLAGGLAFSGTTLTLGAITPTSVTSAGAILSSSPTAGIGYNSGARGTVTQLTNKGTAVGSNTASTDITLNAASLAANTAVSFQFNNTGIGANDTLILNHVSGGTFGAYALNAHGFGAGSCTIDVRNLTAGALLEAIVVRAILVKG